MFFFHGIGTTSSYIKGDWKVRLKNLFVNQCANISTSTLQVGDSIQNMSRGFGVLLANGEVTDAYPYNAITNIGDNLETQDSLDQRIESAIINRNSNALNEFKVKKIGIAGVCINLDEQETQEGDHDSPSPEDLYIECKRIGVPVFCMVNGYFYNTEYISETKTFVPVGMPIHPKNFSANEFELRAELYEEIIEEFRHSLPFTQQPLAIFQMRKLLEQIQDGSKIINESLVLNKLGYGENEIDTFVLRLQNIGTNEFRPLDKYFAVKAYAVVDGIRNNTEFSNREEQVQLILSRVQDILSYDQYLNFRRHINDKWEFILTRKEIETLLNTGELDWFSS